METTIEPIAYSTRAEELLWGLVLIAFSLIIHGFGMVLTLHASGSFKERFGAGQRLFSSIAAIILGSWMILAVHIVEIVMWAGFLQLKDCFQNFSTAVYFTGLEYTTVGSNLNLPKRWRLLEIMISSAGLLGFAWSTGVLMTLAQDFQREQLRRLSALRFMGWGGKSDRGAPDSPPTDVPT